MSLVLPVYKQIILVPRVSLLDPRTKFEPLQNKSPIQQDVLYHTLRQTVFVGVSASNPHDLDAQTVYALDGVCDQQEYEKWVRSNMGRTVSEYNAGEETNELRLRVMPALSNKSQALNPGRDLGAGGSLYDLQPSQAVIRYAQQEIPKPLNLRTLMSQKVFDDDLKAQEVLFQYQKLSKYQRHQQHKTVDSPCARLTSLFKSQTDHNFVYLKHQRQPLQDDQPLILDHSLSPSRTLTALLANNECLYFLHSGVLVGSRIYNRRHHGARRVRFSRVQSERVVVYGGPNGMVVYDIPDLHGFMRNIHD